MTSARIVPVGRSVLPFRGLRFAGSDKVLAARTFDPPDSWSQFAVLDSASLDDHNLLRLLEPVFGAAGGPDHSGKVAIVLREWIDDGVLVQDREPMMYAYRRSSPQHVLSGVVAAVRLGDGVQDSLLPHEDVIPQLVDAQRQLELATGGQLEPIVAISTGSSSLEGVIAPVLTSEPVVRIVEDEVVHEMWLLRSPDHHRAVQRAAESGALVIADGHHRYAAWATSGDSGEPWAYGLTMLVDAGALELGPVHRVLPEEDLADVIDTMPIPATTFNDEAGALDFLASGSDTRCVFAAAGRFVGVTAPGCAASWLHDTWAAGRGVRSVEYVHGVDTALRLAEERSGIAVLLSAPSIDTVVTAASRRHPLPHKASSFGPKPRVGLVLRCWGIEPDDRPSDLDRIGDAPTGD